MSDVMTDFDPFADLSDDELDAMLESGEMPDFSGTAGPAPLCADVPEGFRSGFVALVGRPNAGKSTLLNACYGEKVAITSPVAKIARRRLRAVVNREDSPARHCGHAWYPQAQGRLGLRAQQERPGRACGRRRDRVRDRRQCTHRTWRRMGGRARGCRQGTQSSRS